MILGQWKNNKKKEGEGGRGEYSQKSSIESFERKQKELHLCWLVDVKSSNVPSLE